MKYTNHYCEKNNIRFYANNEILMTCSEDMRALLFQIASAELLNY